MLHYHGTPITPRSELLRIPGRCFCVSFASPNDIAIVHQIGQSVMLDNGAFTAWTQGRPVDWDAWAAWADEWLDYNTTWAVLPDVIDGDEDANDTLANQYRSLRNTVPVWHLHESLTRLSRLVDDYGKVCFGSSGMFREVGSFEWHRRTSEAFDALADDFGRVPWVHMLRGMAMSESDYPFASVDSTDIARNHYLDRNNIEQMVSRWDSRQTPARWVSKGTQLTLEQEMVA